MSSVYAPQESSQLSVALLFTNNAGLTVFADRAFLQLMHYRQSTAIIGKPLNKVLGIEDGMAKQLFTELRRVARLTDQLLDAQDANGSQVRLLCSGVATLDSGGEFVGADFRLRQALAEVESIESSYLPLPAATIENDPAIDNTFLQFYFTTRVKALYVLLARLVGPGIHERLDKLINDTAQRNKWPAQIRGGLFTADAATTPVEVYGALMQATERYASNLIGERIVSRELRNVDTQFHQGVLALAIRYGLREPAKAQ